MATANTSQVGSNPSLLYRLWQKVVARFRSNRIRQRSRVRFRLTREGVHFIGILVFIFIGAVIRDINLLILLAGTMIGLLMLQWRFNTSTLVGINVLRNLPSYATSHRDTEIEFTVKNPKRWLSAWLVMVEDPIVQTAPKAKRTGEKGIGIVDAIRPTGASDSSYRLHFFQRGKYSIGPSTISTRFPLGLGRGWRTLDNKAEIVVHPRQGNLTRGVQKLFHLERLGQTKASNNAGAHEGEFYGLRSWTNGDSKRWIHWRTTARLGELSVRQFEQNQKRQICLLLDLYSDKKNGASESVEMAISFLATLATRTVREQRDKLSVGIAGENALGFGAVQSPVLVQNLLDELAVVNPSETPDLSGALKELHGPLLSNPNLIVISTRQDQFGDLQRSSDDPVLDKLLGRVRARWLNVANNDLEPYFQWT